jgi:Fe-S oxidoreductase
MSLADQFSTIDACRCCFMCRHVCTLGVVSGKESDTPRGRGIILFKILKGHSDYSEELVDAIYRCCLCGLCETWCKADCSPPTAVLEARREIVAQGRAPAPVAEIRARILNCGNPFGLPAKQRFQAIDAVDGVQERPEVLYYVGCDAAYRQPEVANAFLRILRACGVRVSLLRDEHSTGKALLLLGYYDDARATAQSLIAKIRGTSCKTIVTTCPSSFDAMTRDYPALGLDLTGIEVLHATSYLNRLAAQNRIPGLSARLAKVTLLDDTYLGRHHGIVDEPRRVLQRIPQLTLHEMAWSRELAYSCGEPGGVFRLLHPDLSVRLARRVLYEAARSDAEVLATSCPIAKGILSEANETRLQLRDVVELVADVL